MADGSISHSTKVPRSGIQVLGDSALREKEFLIAYKPYVVLQIILRDLLCN
jgi:hypothetical protein